MNFREFEIGTEFICGGNLWLCTDKGTRVAIGINLGPPPGTDKANLNGPPYFEAEIVFDEDDFGGCELYNALVSGPAQK